MTIIMSKFTRDEHELRCAMLGAWHHLLTNIYFRDNVPAGYYASGKWVDGDTLREMTEEEFDRRSRDYHFKNVVYNYPDK